jgi:hypothetical protein
MRECLASRWLALRPSEVLDADLEHCALAEHRL